jgi:hypothetical protein
MNIEELKNRYMNDAEFHSIVHMLYEFLKEARFTPYELRQAAYFASLKFETEHTKPQMIIPENGIDNFIP